LPQGGRSAQGGAQKTTRAIAARVVAIDFSKF
jgi:hypothetical protein